MRRTSAQRAWYRAVPKPPVANVLGVKGEILVLEGHAGDQPLSVAAHPDLLALEISPAPEGEEATSFQWIGSSRLPKPLLRRLTEDPPVRIGQPENLRSAWLELPARTTS